MRAPEPEEEGPGDGATRVHTLPGLPGLLTGRRAGGLVLGLEDGLYAFDPEAGLGARIVAVEAEPVGIATYVRAVAPVVVPAAVAGLVVLSLQPWT